jgi:outer membrane protein insertion porin family/translocation and assembly module TamA
VENPLPVDPNRAVAIGPRRDRLGQRGRRRVRHFHERGQGRLGALGRRQAAAASKERESEKPSTAGRHGWPTACSSYAVIRSSVGLLRAAGLVALLFLATGCASAQKRGFNLESLKVTGNSHLDDDEIEERIASRETPKFLGIFPGVIYDDELFNRFVLERDLQRVERLYRSRGYYQAHARAGRVSRSGSNVRVEIVVEEGRPTLLARVDVHGVETLPSALQAEARAAVTDALPLGAPLDEEKLDQASKALAAVLGDNGYAQAVVRKRAEVNLPEYVAAAGFWVEAGQPSEIGEVKLQGLGDLPEDRVRGALSLEPGMPYSQSELDESKRQLLDLGVFSSVEIEPQVSAATPGPNGKLRVPILVKLEKAKLRSVHVGGGVLVDALKSDVHLTFGWEDQSFLGAMRKLQVEVQPGAVLYPTRFPSFQAPDRLLPEGRLRTEFRQPGFITGRTSLVLKGQVAAYPVLLSTSYDPKAPIVGYFDYRASAGLERTFHRLYASLSQNVQLNVPFFYKGEPDKDLHHVVVSYPALYTTFDLRDDSIHPHKGLFLANELELAGVGGDARDLKLQPEARAYVPLAKHVTLAGRASIGLLFAQNYGQTVEDNALTGAPAAGTTRAEWVKDVQLMFMRGFFSGGSGSNRGYAPREIGPHGVVPFYNYGQTQTSLGVNCTASSASAAASGAAVPDADTKYDPAVCDLPLGGFTLWEAGLELRYPLSGALSGAVFADTSDVSGRALSFRFNRPHLSVGLGLRYDTPVGPVRFDLGYRVPGLQAPAGAADEAVPKPFPLFKLPLAASFGIGESY